MNIDETATDTQPTRLSELKALRDEIRVDLHLAGMDLRDEWKRLEEKLRLDQWKDMAEDAAGRLCVELKEFRARLRGPA